MRRSLATSRGTQIGALRAGVIPPRRGPRARRRQRYPRRERRAADSAEIGRDRGSYAYRGLHVHPHACCIFIHPYHTLKRT